MKICVNCGESIKPKEHYFEVIERKNNFILAVKYVHKTCQDRYDKQIKESQVTPELIENFKSTMSKANNLLTKMGGEEVVYIQ